MSEPDTVVIVPSTVDHYPSKEEIVQIDLEPCHIHSMGYWKTHLTEWPNDTTDKIFCGKSWTDIMKTPPDLNNKWRIVAKQWITTQLNILICNHPSHIPQVVTSTLEDLADLLSAYCEPELGTITARNRAYQLKEILESYNLGPNNQVEKDPESLNQIQVINSKIDEIIQEIRKPYSLTSEIPNCDQLLLELFHSVEYRFRNGKLIIPIDSASPKAIKIPSEVSEFRFLPPIAYHIYTNLIILDKPAVGDLTMYVDIENGKIQVFYL